MPDLEIQTAARVEQEPVAWLRVLRLAGLGGVLLLVISLPALANEDQSSPSLGWYVVWALAIAAVTSRTYVVVRRSAASKRRALLVAVALVPGSYCIAGLLLWLIVTAWP